MSLLLALAFTLLQVIRMQSVLTLAPAKQCAHRHRRGKSILLENYPFLERANGSGENVIT